MTPEQYFEKYSTFIKWAVIRKTYLLWDEQEDRIQDVWIKILENIEKINGMSEEERKRYIFFTAVRMPKRHSWGNCKFMTLLDSEERRRLLSGKNIEEKDDPLAWLSDGGKYRPDSEYWEYLERRAKREAIQDQIEQYKKIKDVCASVKVAVIYGGSRGRGIKTGINLKLYSQMTKLDPFVQNRNKLRSKVYRAMNAERIKERSVQFYNSIKYNPEKHAQKLEKQRQYQARKRVALQQTYLGTQLEEAFSKLQKGGNNGETKK